MEKKSDVKINFQFRIPTRTQTRTQSRDRCQNTKNQFKYVMEIDIQSQIQNPDQMIDKIELLWSNYKKQMTNAISNSTSNLTGPNSISIDYFRSVFKFNFISLSSKRINNHSITNEIEFVSTQKIFQLNSKSSIPFVRITVIQLDFIRRTWTDFIHFLKTIPSDQNQCKSIQIIISLNLEGTSH